MSRIVTGLLLLSMLAAPREGFALITGGEGNEPVADPGEPTGAASMFNTRARIAWWEAPPFGGGHWHGECRGDAATFNTILQDFAKLDVKAKRIVLHDGIGYSFWLGPNKKAPAGWYRVVVEADGFVPRVASYARFDPEVRLINGRTQPMG